MSHFAATIAKPRPGKPRRAGFTWISLFGEGPKQIEALLETTAPYIDRAKLAYGSSVLADDATLKAITALLRAAAIDVYPGGTLLEMALHSGRREAFFDWVAEMGFTGLEVCDGVIEMSDEVRAGCIAEARRRGLTVTSVIQEVIRKPVIEVLTLAERIERARKDLAAGASQAHVVFQAMVRGETPSDVVGPVKREQVRLMVEALGAEALVFEAPTTDNQLAYLRLLGPEVSLGHVDPRTVVQLEAQRRGLGYESFWSQRWGRPHWS